MSRRFGLIDNRTFLQTKLKYSHKKNICIRQSLTGRYKISIGMRKRENDVPIQGSIQAFGVTLKRITKNEMVVF